MIHKKLNPLTNSISLWFGIIMVLLVFAGALAFGFTSLMIEQVSGMRRTFLVIIFVAYGIFRSVRIYQVIKQARHEA